MKANLFNKVSSSLFIGISFVALLGLMGWPSLDNITELGNAKDLKKGLINSTGVVTADQVDTVMKAADKINEASRGFSAEQQYYLGRGVAALILKRWPLYKGDPSLTKYINLIGNALASRSSRPEIFGGYHFAILDTEELNALSTPGGFIFVSKGFLKIIPNEEALAAVLAHEIGHVILGHGINAISNAHISEAGLMLGKEAMNTFGPAELSSLTTTFGDSINEIFETLITSGYGRSQEYEADAFAGSLMAKVGYSTEGLTTVLDQLGKAKGQSKGGWMDTHPAPGERKASLKKPKQKVDADAVQVRNVRFEKTKIH